MKNYFNLNICRTVRHTGYLFWTIATQVVDSGISRVVFYPLLVYLVGKEEFGVFAIAQSVVLIIGATPADGLMTGLLRHTAHYPKERHNQLYHTAMRLDHIAMVIIVALRLDELVEEIEKALGKKAVIEHKPVPPGDVERTCADITKAGGRLGYNPGTDIADGLKKFVERFSLKNQLPI